ncbi:MAG: 1-acyl-sn-glycerol-3-phosphate acyltransferase [Rhodospirillales bacterium]|nr:1-acyl-sn-glycerol-3-phosphate acyltransferase [Rhodospirillales bacterium]
MRDAPSRLVAKRTPLVRTAFPAGAEDLLSGAPPRRHRRLRAIRRIAEVILWTLPAMAVQALLLLLPGGHRPADGFARFYWRVICRLIGLKVRVIGAPAASARGRAVVYVSNHSSWLDIAALGGRLPGRFVAKADVAGWPVIGQVARLGRSVFVSRQRGRTGTEREALEARLAAGDDLILFPEGTTSDGSRVLPFRSSFFALADGPSKPLIQPVSIVYDRLAGLPTGRASRPLFAWYGDMDIASHAWRLTQQRGLRVTILLHTPIDPARYADRKALSRTVWTIVADGAATLRQNRPAEALSAPETPEAPETEASAAFA